MTIFTPLGIEGVWLVQNKVYNDDRGILIEWMRTTGVMSTLGIDFTVKQANYSQSSAGVIRGIHYSLAPEGQAKYITCTSGKLWDVIVDIRIGSQTFGKWVATELTAGDGQAIFISKGLGHGFQALSDSSSISYLLSSIYNPNLEYSINPLDPDLNIKWPIKESKISDRDREAPLFTKRKI